jgi:hypothetical protein
MARQHGHDGGTDAAAAAAAALGIGQHSRRHNEACDGAETETAWVGRQGWGAATVTMEVQWGMLGD